MTDQEIPAAYQLLAETEGIFCEPASAASLAGVAKLAAADISPGAKVVAVLTGHGLATLTRLLVYPGTLVLEPNLEILPKVLSPARS